MRRGRGGPMNAFFHGFPEGFGKPWRALSPSLSCPSPNQQPETLGQRLPQSCCEPWQAPGSLRAIGCFATKVLGFHSVSQAPGFLDRPLNPINPDFPDDFASSKNYKTQVRDVDPAYTFRVSKHWAFLEVQCMNMSGTSRDPELPEE